MDKPEIKRTIESKTEKRTIELMSKASIKTNQQMQESLVEIMKDGEKEFREKMGRNMTYSEMREMYG
jgi:hypothetical protein